jgi:hypothetical protein
LTCHTHRSQSPVRFSSDQLDERGLFDDVRHMPNACRDSHPRNLEIKAMGLGTVSRITRTGGFLGRRCLAHSAAWSVFSTDDASARCSGTWQAARRYRRQDVFARVPGFSSMTRIRISKRNAALTPLTFLQSTPYLQEDLGQS